MSGTCVLAAPRAPYPQRLADGKVPPLEKRSARGIGAAAKRDAADALVDPRRPGSFPVENASIRTGAMVNLYEAWAGADRQAGPSPPAKDDVKRRISRLLGSIPLIFADSTKERIWRRIEIIDIFI
jgi:hypothetical protein